MKTNVVVLDDYEGIFARSPAIRSLERICTVCVYPTQASDEEELVERLQRAEIVIPIRERSAFPESVLSRLNNLRLIAQTGTGVAHIDAGAARERGVRISNMPGESEASVAELTFMLMLSCLRHLPDNVVSMRRGGWAPVPGQELRGKSLGLIGFGSIGREVARLADAFRTHVVAWSPSLTPERAREYGASYAPLDLLVKTVDIVSLHLRAAPQFRGLLGRQRLGAMKPGAILINTSRAELVDTVAAVDLLHSGHLAAAGFDVFDDEPLPANARIRELSNVTLTPHVGWLTEDLLDRFAAQAAEEIERFVLGRSVPGVP